MRAKTAIGAALIVMSLCIAGGGVYALHALKQKKFDLDTLCPLEGPKSVTSILIDKTDPLTQGEQASIGKLIEEERGSLRAGGRIVIRLLKQTKDTNETGLDTAADLCNPGSEANPLFENPKRVAARYTSAFLGPLSSALDSANMTGSAPTSPVAGALAAIARDLPEVGSIPSKILLITDLMEYTSSASAYTGTLTEDYFRRQIPPAALERLRNADLRIFLLSRPRHVKQQEVAVAIWVRFLKERLGREPQLLRL